MPDDVTGTRKRRRKGKASEISKRNRHRSRVNAVRFPNLNRASPDSRIPWDGNILHGQSEGYRD